MVKKSLAGLSYSFAMHIIDKLQKNPVVRMRDPAAVKAKVQKIIHDGYDKLLVIIGVFLNDLNGCVLGDLRF